MADVFRPQQYVYKKFKLQTKFKPTYSEFLVSTAHYTDPKRHTIKPGTPEHGTAAEQWNLP